MCLVLEKKVGGIALRLRPLKSRTFSYCQAGYPHPYPQTRKVSAAGRRDD